MIQPRLSGWAKSEGLAKEEGAQEKGTRSSKIAGKGKLNRS